MHNPFAISECPEARGGGVHKPQWNQNGYVIPAITGFLDRHGNQSGFGIPWGPRAGRNQRGYAINTVLGSPNWGALKVAMLLRRMFSPSGGLMRCKSEGDGDVHKA